MPVRTQGFTAGPCVANRSLIRSCDQDGSKASPAPIQSMEKMLRAIWRTPPFAFTLSSLLLK